VSPQHFEARMEKRLRTALARVAAPHGVRRRAV
jgi:hypothetical protein